MSIVDENYKFPISYLLPKQETQQEEFLSKYPEYDGRGIVMAILDTGIDPGLPGLQKTSDGRRKIIEIMNCTGDGDVDTSVIRTAKNGYVKGLSGRKLKIPDHWTNPSGKYHLGIKSIFELYPELLMKRMKEERMKALFDVPHKLAVADVMRQISNFDETVGTSMSDADKEKRDDLQDLLSALKRNDNLEDVGPMADCLVFHDGKEFKACIDTSFRGRLNLALVLRNYKDSGDYAKLTDKDFLNVSVNIHNEGNLLEICVVSKNHGSHVANIAAAHYPDDPEKSGLAPGVQLVSLCIGDCRLSSIETGIAYSRAIARCIDLKVDLINVSYGEDTHFPGVGKIIEKFETLVYKHGVIMFASAGNKGPGLCTVGTPGGTAGCAIGVGAFISPEMMDYMYSKKDKIERSFYQWSSRGPSYDGALGVSICAPGAAITGVANFSLKKAQLLNGTSMSSPNAAGSAACLLSALKANSIPWCPYLIRLAIENTAKPTKDYCPLVYGCGILQIDAAFEYLKKYSNEFSLSFNGFKIKNNITGGRGIHIREIHESIHPCDYAISIIPEFKLDPKYNCDKLEFEKFLVLTCADSYVTHSKNLALMHDERKVQISVDPSNLKPGSYNFTQVLAYDSKNISMGPVFRIPITIIKPLSLDQNVNATVREFEGKPARPDRLFLSIPLDVDWISLKLSSMNAKDKTECVLHVMQALPNSTRRERCKVMEMLPNRAEELAVFLKGGYTAEICLVKQWQCMDNIGIKMEVSLHGTPIIPRDLTIFASNIVSRFDIRNSLLCSEVVTPAITFRHICETRHPIESKIFPLSPRDNFDGAPMFCLGLTYSYQHVDETAEVAFCFEGLSNYLYESALVGYLILVFTSNKMYVGCSCSFSERHIMKLKKGDYRILVQVHHTDQSLLTSLENLSLIVERRLSHAISLSCYPTLKGALSISGRKIIDKVMNPGQTSTVFVSRLTDEKLLKNASPGTYLKGKACVIAADYARSVVQYPVRYVLNSNIRKITKDKEDDKKILDLSKVQDSARDFLIKNLLSLKKTEAEEVIKRLEKRNPNCLHILQAKLLHWFSLVEMLSSKECEEVFAIVDQIVSIAEPEKVLQYFGAANPNYKADSSLQEDMELRRNALQSAFVTKAHILADAHLYISTADVPRAFKNGLLRACENEKLANILIKEQFDLNSKGIKKIMRKGMMQKKNMNDAEKVKYDVNGDVGDPSNPVEIFSIEDVSESPPDVVDKKITLKDLNDSYDEVMKWNNPTDSKVILLSAKRAMANGYFGTCLKYLSKAAKEGVSSEQCMDVTFMKIYEHLGWIHISSFLQNIFLHKYREKYRLF